MNTREAFEDWYEVDCYPCEHSNWFRLDSDGDYEFDEVQYAWRTWQAATAAALEIAIQVCEAIENDKWALYKGRPPYTGAEPGRADNYVQGESGGAGSCAAAIRALKESKE